MHVYRLCKEGYSNLDGDGASKTNNSWNSKGKHVIYTSENIALTILEILVHLDYDLIPNDYCLLTIDIPDNCTVEQYSKTTLSRNETIRFGDEWLTSKRSLILATPSYIINKEKNILINPNHPEFTNIKVINKEPFNFDSRLFK
ncbi:MAG: RES domain-containing protein [bacterium]